MIILDKIIAQLHRVCKSPCMCKFLVSRIHLHTVLHMLCCCISFTPSTHATQCILPLCAFTYQLTHSLSKTIHPLSLQMILLGKIMAQLYRVCKSPGMWEIQYFFTCSLTHSTTHVLLLYIIITHTTQCILPLFPSLSVSTHTLFVIDYH